MSFFQVKSDMNDDHGKKMDEEFLGEIIMYLSTGWHVRGVPFSEARSFFVIWSLLTSFVEYWRSMFTMFKFLSADIADPDPFSSLNHPSIPFNR